MGGLTLANLVLLGLLLVQMLRLCTSVLVDWRWEGSRWDMGASLLFICCLFLGFPVKVWRYGSESKARWWGM